MINDYYLVLIIFVALIYIVKSFFTTETKEGYNGLSILPFLNRIESKVDQLRETLIEDDENAGPEDTERHIELNSLVNKINIEDERIDSSYVPFEASNNSSSQELIKNIDNAPASLFEESKVGGYSSFPKKFKSSLFKKIKSSGSSSSGSKTLSSGSKTLSSGSSSSGSSSSGSKTFKSSLFKMIKSSGSSSSGSKKSGSNKKFKFGR